MWRNLPISGETSYLSIYQQMCLGHLVAKRPVAIYDPLCGDTLAKIFAREEK